MARKKYFNMEDMSNILKTYKSFGSACAKSLFIYSTTEWPMPTTDLWSTSRWVSASCNYDNIFLLNVSHLIQMRPLYDYIYIKVMQRL
jgi:hypothetical protein